MNTQATETVVKVGTGTETADHEAVRAATERKSGATPKSKAAGADKPSKKTKKDQLVALLSKPNGARVSVIVQRLGWQPHTVRAALSGLRKQGFEIATSKSSKSGEAVYAIVARPNGDGGKTEGAAS
jgi:hypothetical protein